MADELEFPGNGDVPDWDSLYRARSTDIAPHRPVFTGDVFQSVEVYGLGETKVKTIMVLQHPCALRTDGVELHPRLVVAEVRRHKVIPALDWTGHVSKMPLPDLIPQETSSKRHQAAFFDALYLVGPDALKPDKRIAVLSQKGVNLLLQRWVHHNSRAAIHTARFQEVSSPAYEEADLIEEWCEDRLDAGADLQTATVEAVTWLRGYLDGVTHQRLLEDPQNRSAVRRRMRAALRLSNPCPDQ